MGLNTAPDLLKPYGVLSGGQRKRVDTALATQRSGVVLDDFSDGVEPQLAFVVAASLRRAVQSRKLANVLVATRDPSLTRFLQPDRLVVLSADGAPPLVLENPNAVSLRRPRGARVCKH